MQNGRQILPLLFVIISAVCGCGSPGSDGGNRSAAIGNHMIVQFSPTVLDHYQEKVVTLRNSGKTSEYIGAIGQADALKPPFYLVADKCSDTTLGPNESCTLTIRFITTQQDIFNETFGIQTGSSPIIVHLSGKAITYNASIQQVDKSACPSVRLLVSVTDRDDVPVSNLAAGNFSIFENGRPQKIIGFANELAAPVSVAGVLDYSNSLQGYIADVETAVTGFIDSLQLNSTTDEAAIFKFAETVELKQPFTEVYDLLAEAIADPYAGGTYKTLLYDALGQAVALTADPLRNTRRAVVVLSDGYDEGSTAYQLNDVIAYANENGVPVFTISLGHSYSVVLQNLADATGGAYFAAPDAGDLQSIYRSISEILGNQYVIEYQSTSVGAQMIDLDVELDHLGAIGSDSKTIAGCQ